MTVKGIRTQKQQEQFHYTKSASSSQTGISVSFTLYLQCLEQGLTIVGTQYLWNATIKLVIWQIEFQPTDSQQTDFGILACSPSHQEEPKKKKNPGAFVDCISGHIGVSKE